MSSWDIYKNVPQRSMVDWHTGLDKLRNVSRSQRYEAFDTRNTSIQLRNETRVLTQWNTLQNNDRLHDRIFTVDIWRDELQHTFNCCNQEKFYLGQEKLLTEKCLEALQVPLSVISECLSNRDNRRLTESTTDYLETELKKELLLAETHKQNISDLIFECWETLSRLDAIIKRLETEILNKMETIKIDAEQLKMDKNSAMISYKAEPFRVFEESLTVDSWLQLTKDTIVLAHTVMAESKQLREKVFQAREKSKNELFAQKQVVDHALRKRVFETQKSKNELEWQKKKTLNSMMKTAEELSHLNDALVGKINVAKLADTRGENRTYRPRLELVRDAVAEGIEEEARNVRFTMKQLQDKIEQIKGTYNNLECVLMQIEQELSNKCDTLSVDSRCTEIRVPMHISHQTHTDHNVQLLKLRPLLLQ